MSKKSVFAFALLAALLLASGLADAITGIDVPVPQPKPQASPNIVIIANGVGASDGKISTSRKDLTVEIQGLDKGKDFFIGLNATLDKEISKINTGSPTKIDPAKISYNDIKQGVRVKVVNKKQTENKVFYITDWGEGKQPITVSVCQDKSSPADGKCTESNEYAIAVIRFEELKVGSILEALAKLSQRFAIDLFPEKAK